MKRLVLALALATASWAANAASNITVYRDYNGDGVQQAGEPGVPGATVNAFTASGAVISATTADNGVASLLTANSTAYRFEVAAPTGLQMGGATTSGQRSDVQFGTDPAGATNLALNFAASNAAQYCASAADADLIAIKNVREQLAGTTAQQTITSWNYQADSTGAIGAQTVWAVDQTNPGVVVGTGAQWGLAYRKRGDIAFSASFVRGGSPLAGSATEESTGNIYRSTRNAAGVVTTSLYINLNAGAFGTIDTGANPHPRPTNYDTLPLPAREETGKFGLGDIDLSEDESRLYAVNLFQKELLVIPLGTGLTPTVPASDATIQRISIPRPTGVTGCANDADFRPFAVGINDGNVYVGAVCTAQNVAPTTDPLNATRQAAMRGFVLQLDAAGTAFIAEPVLNFSLDYPRRFANDGTDFADSGNWLPWNDDPTAAPTGYGNTTLIAYPQAILSDLAFDNFGFLTIGLTDRLNFQRFDEALGGQPGSRFAGDMLLACENGSGGFNLETNGACTARGVTRTSADPTNNGTVPDDNTASGPGGREFYFGERYNYSLSTADTDSPMNGQDYHRESASGALALLGGQGGVVTTVYDVGATFNNGTRVMNQGNLAETNTGLMYRDGGYMAAPDTPASNNQYHEFRVVEGNVYFGKGNGLGDVEVLCEAAQPIQIGNLVFNDANANGVQDPGEAGISGITFELYNAAGTIIGRTTTDANGNYAFSVREIDAGSDSNTTDADVQLLFAALYGQNVFVGIPGTTAAGVGTGGGGGNIANTLRATLVNSNTGVLSDNRDSEGVVLVPGAGTARVGTVITLPANAGASNYSIDFGFRTSAALNSIGNRIWYDTNNNGIFDAGEQPIAGVQVDLRNGTNTLGIDDPHTAATDTYSVSTDATGYYRFDDIANGSYIIRVAASNFTGAGVLVGYSNSAGATAATENRDNGTNASAATATTTGVLSGAVALTAGSNVATETDLSFSAFGTNGPSGTSGDDLRVDFGFYRTVISNRVYFDTNNSGTRDGTEGVVTPAVLQNLRVELRDSFNVLIAVAFTDVNGNYSFSGATNNAGVANGLGIPSKDGAGTAISYRVVIPTLPTPATGDTLTASTTAVAVGAGGASLDNNTATINGTSVQTGAFTITSGTTTTLQTIVNATGETTQPSADFGFIRLDFGDLPDTAAGIGLSNYNTNLSDNGPRHLVVPGLFLGNSVDGDTDGAPNSGATGDNTLDAFDDETGWFASVYSNPTSPCLGTTTLRFNATAPNASSARLNVFVDRNGDGDFNDPSEVGSTTFSGTGSNQVVLVVLPARTLGQCGNVTAGGVVAVRARLALATDMVAATTGNAATLQAGLINSGEVEDYVTSTPGTVPVTLSNVSIKESGPDLVVNFNTATEAGTLGFRVLADIGKGVQARVEIASVASKTIDSLKEQAYSVRARNPGADQVWIEESSVDGKAELYGPYKVGSSVGEVGLAQPLNWAVVNAEQSAFRAVRETALRGLSAQAAEVRVSTDGWVRITHAQLLAAGVDFAGQPVENITVRLGSVAVPARVSLGAKSFGAGSTIEFFAKAVKGSLYTTTAVYRIGLGRGFALPEIDARNTERNTGPQVQSAPDLMLLNNNTTYSFSSPLEDPWFSFRALRSGGASVGVGGINFTLKDREAPSVEGGKGMPGVSAGAEETLEVSFWGGLEYAGETPDHLAVFKLNGTVLGQRAFDGFTAQTQRFVLPAGVLLSGSNTFTVELPNSTGYAADIVNVESVSIGYTRKLIAQSDRLSVQLPATPALSSDGSKAVSEGDKGGTKPINASVFIVAGLSGKPVVAVLERGGVQSVLKTDAVTGGNLRIELNAQTGDRLSVMPAESSVLPTAAIALEDPISGDPGRYLIISHPSFIANLSPLVLAKQQQGFTVKVVDVEAIYRYYSAGVIDPAAIQLAIRRAQSKLGTTHVLLVGGDTYDYQNVLGINSVSFIPTNYRRTSDIIAFAPSDAVYADTDSNGVPNIAIGRWPVRTNAELNAILGKTLNYQNTHKALFISDRSLNGVSYASQTAPLANLLGQNWITNQLSLDSYASGQAATARADIVSQLEGGASLLSYYGHSAPASWSREGLITASLVSGGLFNTVNQPFATVQLGCWGTYFVEPTSTTVAHQMLLMPKGAAAVLGATSLTESNSDISLANHLLPRLSSTDLGDALVQAQQAVANELPQAADVILGGTLLGDPALR